MDFVVSHQLPRRVPCCLLLPNWVSRKSEYRKRFVTPIVASREPTGQDKSSNNFELFYLAPLQPYTYTMPSFVASKDRPNHVGSNGQTTPYQSCWYLVVPTSHRKGNQTKSLLDSMDAMAKRQSPQAWVVAKTVKGLKWKAQKVAAKQQQGR